MPHNRVVLRRLGVHQTCVEHERYRQPVHQQSCLQQEEAHTETGRDGHGQLTGQERLGPVHRAETQTVNPTQPCLSAAPFRAFTHMVDGSNTPHIMPGQLCVVASWRVLRQRHCQQMHCERQSLPAIVAGTGMDGRAVKISGGGLLGGRAPCTEGLPSAGASCRSGWATWVARGGSSVKRVRPFGVLELADCAAVPELGLEKTFGIQEPAGSSESQWKQEQPYRRHISYM